MESRQDLIANLISEGLDGNDVDVMIAALLKIKVSSKSKSTTKDTASEYSMEDLKLKSLKFYYDEIGLP